jgi:hypothetical protein
MVLRVLAHPEAERDAFLRLARRAWNEQQQPTSGRLGRPAFGAVPVLPAISPAWLTGNASDFCFPLLGFHLPDRIAQRIACRG